MGTIVALNNINDSNSLFSVSPRNGFSPCRSIFIRSRQHLDDLRSPLIMPEKTPNYFTYIYEM